MFLCQFVFYLVSQALGLYLFNEDALEGKNSEVVLGVKKWRTTSPTACYSQFDSICKSLNRLIIMLFWSVLSIEAFQLPVILYNV